ncbi:hydantoinase/oxoprolinase N-terminal domain-containing protein [Brevibacillus massiliensis]|uniref:hydantoinase/oxoprolinase N-terminal domain-containing protein n=1 Tax=Brevibacillus massiliensis TaxID=1118054 RepID=UPI001FE0EE4B|nr:hydantoinase/oxoprolinase N-terminal domain-containing protein [Brevibacillus massiliensis]
MLQEQWAKDGLITTKGFRDVLEIGTQMRPKLYARGVKRQSGSNQNRRHYVGSCVQQFAGGGK